MKKFIFGKTNSFFMILFLISIFQNVDKAQQQEQFIIGAYMHSTPWGHIGAPTYHPHDSTLFSVWRALDMGINTAMVYVRLPESDDSIHYVGPFQGTLPSNMELLEAFPNVIAMNQYSSHLLLEETAPDPANVTIRNFDWIRFYTGAYYSKWDATETSIPLGKLGLKHEFGGNVVVNDKTYWSSHGSGIPSMSDTVFIKGPNYFQETRYRGSAYPTLWDNAVQKYKVNFNLSLREPVLPENVNTPVCEIRVVAKYYSNEAYHTEILAYRTLTAGEIGVGTNNILEYDYSDFCQNAFRPPVGPVPEEKESSSYCEENEKRLENVEFRVKYLNSNFELLIDHIEVYDEDIWEERLSTEFSQTQARYNIIKYLDSFKDNDPDFYANNLKYFMGVDEPHSVDCYVPHAFVRETLSSIPDAPQLFTHFYPEWSGQRDGADVFPPYVNTVQPEPLHFYYAPFKYNYSTQSSLNDLRNIFYWMYHANGSNDFLLTIDVWDDSSIGWRGPNPEELNAAVMLSLAHGAKGIFYEPFYSYDNTGGLLNFEEPYEPNATGLKVKNDINPRLNGVLGSTLLKLKYTGIFSNIYESNISFLEIFPQYIEGLAYHHGGLLLSKDDPVDNNYILFTNLLTATNYNINLRFSKPNSVYTNWKLKNVETGWEETFIDSISHESYYLAGDGKLFQVAPVVKYGGEILTNDTITNNITLNDNMILYDTVFIAEDKLYNINYDIDLQNHGFITGNGYITTDSNLTITTNNWSRTLLKGKHGSNPRLLWAPHPTLSGVINYKIYRKKESQTFELLAIVSGTTYTYVDTTVEIVSGATQQNETIAEYYITAIYSISKGGQSESTASNTIKFHRVEGSAPQKQGSEALIVYTYNLEQNYPNPFNPTTTINYEVATKNGNNAIVKIKVFDILGKEVTTLVNEEKQEGRYSITFDASHLSNGVYFYSMKSGEYYSVKKMILLK